MTLVPLARWRESGQPSRPCDERDDREAVSFMLRMEILSHDGQSDKCDVSLFHKIYDLDCGATEFRRSMRA